MSVYFQILIVWYINCLDNEYHVPSEDPNNTKTMSTRCEDNSFPLKQTFAALLNSFLDKGRPTCDMYFTATVKSSRLFESRQNVSKSLNWIPTRFSSGNAESRVIFFIHSCNQTWVHECIWTIRCKDTFGISNLYKGEFTSEL